MAARVALLVALVLATLAGAVYLHQHDPSVTSIFGGCRFREMTGYYCPGCGGTRATHALLHLRLGQALGYNPLIFVVLALFLVLASVIARELLGDYYRGPRWRVPGWMGWSLAALVLVFWGLRNIPVWPFTVLAP